jgi:hypothetical protein
LAIEAGIDIKCRSLAAELFAAAQNGADSERAQKVVELLEFAMSMAKSDTSVGYIKYAVDRTRKTEIAEENRKRKRVARASEKLLESNVRDSESAERLAATRTEGGNGAGETGKIQEDTLGAEMDIRDGPETGEKETGGVEKEKTKVIEV